MTELLGLLKGKTNLRLEEAAEFDEGVASDEDVKGKKNEDVKGRKKRLQKKKSLTDDVSEKQSTSNVPSKGVGMCSHVRIMERFLTLA